MNEHVLSADAQAILLLTGTLGRQGQNRVAPLNIREFNELMKLLAGREMRPGDLLQTDLKELLADVVLGKIPVDRIGPLLERGASLALDIEAWTNRGGWVVSRADEDYPQRLRKALGSSAPPALYGVGQRGLLEKGGLAMVGSRDADQEGIEFTRMTASLCAKQGIQVVSGGARGVDSHSMNAALERGGTVLGVMAENLARASIEGSCREYLMEGSLCLITPYHPEAKFDVGNAMGRNKHIYALSDWALVVSSQKDKGGTWAGAVEDIKNKWAPLFVRSGDPVPEGNAALISDGGIPLPSGEVAECSDLRAFFNRKAGIERTVYSDKIPVAAVSVGEPAEKNPMLPAGDEIFEAVWPFIGAQIARPRTAEDLAKKCKVTLPQMRLWLKQAEDLGRVNKSKKPVKYRIRDEHQDDQPSLFR